MITQELLDYIRQQLQQGIEKEQIKNSLLANSWQEQDVEEAFISLDFAHESVAPTTTPFKFSQPQRRFNKIFGVVLSIIVIGVIIGGGIFAYFNYFQSPEKIIQKMTTNLTEIKSLEYSGEIKTEIKGDLLGSSNSFLQPTQPTSNKKESNSSFSFAGSSDIQNPNNPKSQFSFNIKTDTSALGEFTFGLEVKTIDKIVYIKLGNMPNLGFFGLGALANQWIKIDIKAIREQFGLDTLEEQLKEEQKNQELIPKQGKQELTPEQIEKLKIVLQQAKIFKIIKKLAGEKIEGVNTYHYKFALDKDGIKKLIIDIAQIGQSKTLTKEELADIDKNFNKSFEAIELTEGEIWIGKKDLLPYKITFNSTIKETNESKISGTSRFILLLKNFNKPIQVDVPQGAKAIEEILGELFKSFSSGTTSFMGQ